jgi:GDPmannose 4,6-dehydratase
MAAQEMGFSLTWVGEGADEAGVVAAVHREGVHCQEGDVVVRVDPRYFRPTEVETLLGDATKARERLGWVPSTPIGELVREMVQADHRIARRDAMVKLAGFPAFEVHE